MLMQAQNAHLIVIDFQERLMPAVHNGEQTLRNAAILVNAAQALGIPITVTEQYPRGLGATVSALREHFKQETIIEKITFSAFREDSFKQEIEAKQAMGRSDLIVTGAEAHICVLQTALDCLAVGYKVFMVGDAVTSRTTASIDAAKLRFTQAGGQWVTTEMVVFEWLQRAGTPDFKALSALIR